MSEKKQLNDNNLKQASGGNGGRGAMGAYCACRCGKLYTANAFSMPSKGEVLGTCSKGWKAIYLGNLDIRYYNEQLDQTKSGSFSGSY